MLRRISRTALPAARSPKTPPNWPNPCSTKRASLLCPATPLALPDTCGCRTRLPSSASRKACAASSASSAAPKRPPDSLLDSVRPEPIRIEPIFSPRLWGSRSLAPIYLEKNNLAEPLGEAWLTGVDCKIASGPFSGKSLGDAWSAMPVEWRGTRLVSCKDFPILVKFIFPQDKLSIQVHPDDAYAAPHEQAAGGRGKTEMWHAVSSEPGARLLLGLKPGTDKEKFLDAMKENRLEDVFQSRPVTAGDTFFVAAGTPHTIGPRMILCEVQEYSDLTYRVYDYGRVDDKGRLRELHIEKAMEVMKFEAEAPSKIIPLQLPSSHAVTKTLLSACSFFAVERWELRA